MRTTLAPSIERVLENYFDCWNTYEEGGCLYTECEFLSGAGEDFVFGIRHGGTKKAFIDGFYEYVCGFDPDEHAEMWIEARGRGGVPQSIRTLIDDADSIEKTLIETYQALRRIL